MRSAAAPAFVTLVVLGVGGGAAVRAARPSRPLIVAEKRGDPDPALPVGYWVWSRLEGAGGALIIRDEDLTARVGPAGWPDCPDRYVCTRYGIRSLAIGADGAFHYVSNVFTSSDFQHHGSVAGDAVRLTERYSCAHPGWRSAPHATERIRWRRRGETLRVAVTPRIEEGGWPFTAEDTGAWVVFRRVSRAEYYERVLLRLCQPTRGHACAPGCFSTSLVE